MAGPRPVQNASLTAPTKKMKPMGVILFPSSPTKLHTPRGMPDMRLATLPRPSPGQRRRRRHFPPSHLLRIAAKPQGPLAPLSLRSFRQNNADLYHVAIVWCVMEPKFKSRADETKKTKLSKSTNYPFPAISIRHDVNRRKPNTLDTCHRAHLDCRSDVAAAGAPPPDGPAPA